MNSAKMRYLRERHMQMVEPRVAKEVTMKAIASVRPAILSYKLSESQSTTRTAANKKMRHRRA